MKVEQVDKKFGFDIYQFQQHQILSCLAMKKEEENVFQGKLVSIQTANPTNTGSYLRDKQ